MTTFAVSSKKVEKVNTKSLQKYQDIWTNTDAYQQTCMGDIIRTSTHDEKQLFYSNFANGLVGGCVKAYNNHHNLVLRPDDFWIAILTQFSFYVNARSEMLRNKLVDFHGTKELIVNGSGNIMTADYDALVHDITQSISKNLKDENICDWIQSPFSTTTPNDQMVCSIALMSSVQKYFTYKMCLDCGIPYVTLLGNVDDYKLLSRKIARLVEFEIEGQNKIITQWCQSLQFICEHLIKSKTQLNKEFWDCICCNFGGGSGPSYLSGWITNFCVFNEQGQWQATKFEKCGSLNVFFPKIDMNDVPSGIVNVPVTIDDNGKDYKTRFLAGSLMCSLPDESTIQPRLDWCICKIDEKKFKKSKW